MKRTSKTLLMAAAMSGLIGGAAVHAEPADTNAPPTTNAVPGKAAPATKSPAVHGCGGQNDCKGLGGCKTDDHACKFQNACKGKGGCEVTEKDIKTWEKQQKEKSGKLMKDPARQVCAVISN